MRNFVQPGNALDLIAPTGGVVTGKAVKIGAIIALASITAAEGEAFSGWVEGVYDVDAVTSQAWSVGDVVYWDDTAKKFTKTSTSNTKAGIVVSAKDSAGTVGRIRLVPTI